MKTIGQVFIWFFLTAFVLPIHGQDKAAAKHIIEKINAFYAQMPEFQNEVAYNLYKDHTTKEVVESDTAIMLKSNGSSWFRMGDIETLSDGKYDIMVHHADKVIVVSKYSATATNPLMHLSLDTLLSACSHFETDLFGSVGCLYLGFAGSEATGISICYNQSDYSLYSLTTYYRNERKLNEENNAPLIRPRLEIRYLRTSQPSPVNRQKTQSSWFIRKVGADFKPTEKYKSYQIINQVIEN